MVIKPIEKVFYSPLLLFFISIFLHPAMSHASFSDSSLIKVPEASFPYFSDSGPVDTLTIAISNTLHYLDKLPAEKLFRYGDADYSADFLKESLHLFLSLVGEAKTPDELHRQIMEKFDIFQAVDGGENEVLVTGYYEPVLKGSLTKQAPYLYPLYKTPDDLVVRDGAGGEKRSCRYENGYFVPYWSRAEIEDKKLLAGQELVYLASPIDAFILHVQGSGRILLPDGKIRQINYAAKNGRPYSSIGKHLVEKGAMRLEDVSLPAIRCYLEENKDECLQVLQHNQSYIFFKWGMDGQEGPTGCLGEPLTPMRSVALDQSSFPPGALAFLQTWEPGFDTYGKITGWQPMSVFVLNQDTGSAIKGPGRVDLFWGNGDLAKKAAGHMKHAGSLYFLVKKRE